MTGVDCIELLEPSLLRRVDRLAEIDWWAAVLDRQQGWHYDLDLIWLLDNISALDLPGGATVLDAGAGLGLLQFLLAARGFSVISLDIAPRRPPRNAGRIFDIRVTEIDRSLGTGDYGGFSVSARSIPFVIRRLVGRIWNPALEKERRNDHSSFGRVTFLQAPFNAIPLADRSVDAVVSLSAFEHNSYGQMARSVAELRRILKPRSCLLVTTSASGGQDWYHEASRGWCLSRGTLSEWFEVRDNIVYDFEQTMAGIKASEALERRISPVYRRNPRGGLPFADLKNARYCPVGIRKFESG